MKHNEYQFKAKVWEYQGTGTWHFVTLPQEMGAEIKQLFGLPRHGWGSIPVEVTIGISTWKTSIFPDKESGSYLLPIKSVVRKAEGMTKGDEVMVLIRVLN
jgi:hypothetical protein